jgi:hypothetical protein
MQLVIDMAEHKTRFTVWMDPEILRAAKARALQDGVTVSEVFAAAAKAALIDSDRQNKDERILQAVERVFHLIQRIDRRHVYDHQVLKEMVGLQIRSFFNHIPAVPPRDKDSALLSGKTRFNRFLDVLAANLRSGNSILNDLPLQEIEPQKSEAPEVTTEDPTPRPPVAPSLSEAASPAKETASPVEHPRAASDAVKPPTSPIPPKPSKPTPTTKIWKLFG